MPFSSPHLPLPPQMSRMHSSASLQLAPLVAPQVSLEGLQPPLWQVAAALVWLQLPSCSPSLGILTPLANLAVHIEDARLQYVLLGQSASSQQPEPPAGTQCPLAQVPD